MAPATENSRSLWLDGMPSRRPRPLDRDSSADVVVIGAGIAGALAAERLAARGARVVVIDAGLAGHGVTGHTTGKVSALQQTVYQQIGDAGRAATYAAAVSAGSALIARLVAEHRIKCGFERRDAWVFAADESESETVEKELRAAEEAGLPVTREIDSGLPLPSWGNLRLAGQAQFNAARFSAGLLDLLAADKTIALHERTRATRLKEERGGVLVTTPGGDVSADRAIVATHFPVFDRSLAFARLVPQRSYCIAFETEDEPPEGMYISAGSPTWSLRTAEHGGRRLLIAGGAGHRAGEGDPLASYERLERWAREHFKVGAVTHRWSAQDESTPDHLPQVGRLQPVSERTLMVTGFNKWGLAASGAAALELERLATGESPRWADAFDPWRLGVGDALRLAETGAHFARRFAIDHVFRRNGPVCTHMGCRLRWNAGEDSWDCPCHGSRFDARGKVIEGPATRDLDL